MKLKFSRSANLVVLALALLVGPRLGTDGGSQSGAESRAAKAAPPKPPHSRVDSVIESVKAGLSESLIIRTLQRENKPANLTPPTW